MTQTKNLVRVISREMIKPSSPTPPHLKTMKRSYLDAVLFPVYMPILFFYKPHQHVVITSQRLKESLSHALTSFYPLAGRIRDNLVVDCNDAGVEFVDAKVHARLEDSINDPGMEDSLNQYIPSKDHAATTDGALLLVQINSFDCGGVAVGVSFSHLIADCFSVMSFVKAWAVACRQETNGDEGIICPSFDLANYFPGRELPMLESSLLGPLMSGGNFATKRFVFDKEKILALREKYVTKDSVRPTRVELVSAFIWKNVMHAESINNRSGKTAVFTAYHAVNLRPRKNPPQLLENVFGNGVVPAFAVADSSEELDELASKLRNAIRRIDDGYITDSQSGDVYLNDVYKNLSYGSKGESGYVGFTSWCWFPLYEVDFGLGNPTWVSTAAVTLKNFSILMSSKCGERIEAYASMEQDTMDFLEDKFKLI